jgi:hypothetical protein
MGARDCHPGLPGFAQRIPGVDTGKANLDMGAIGGIRSQRGAIGLQQ